MKKTQKQIIHKIISLENESSLLNFDSPVSTTFLNKIKTCVCLKCALWITIELWNWEHSQ